MSVEPMPMQAVNFGVPQPYKLRSEFRQPRDDNTSIFVAAMFKITNDGSTTVRIGLHGEIYAADDRAESGHIEQITLAAGDTRQFVLQGSWTLTEWAENWAAARTGGHPYLPRRVTGYLICDDGFENGVIDRWKVYINTVPIAPMPGENGGWRINADAMSQLPING